MRFQPHRKERVVERIHRTVAEILSSDVVFESGTLITVHDVSVAPRQQDATVHVTVYPYKQSEKVRTFLKNHRGEIQHLLNKRVRLNPVPKIRFVVDDTEERAHELLKKIEDL